MESVGRKCVRESYKGYFLVSSSETSCSRATILLDLSVLVWYRNLVEVLIYGVRTKELPGVTLVATAS